MWAIIFLISAAVPVYSSKEYVPLSNLPLRDKNLLFELVKRLENKFYDQCAVSTNKTSIIKKVDSLQNGAQFLTSIKNVESNEACWNLCCKNKTCDVSVYECKVI
jgi:hypothetical protein